MYVVTARLPLELGRDVRVAPAGVGVFTAGMHMNLAGKHRAQV